MANTSKRKTGTRRALPKEVRKAQLIRATIKSITKNGLSGTTMATVTSEAGLSLGIANLHFESKEKLLTETLLYVANEYSTGQAAVLNSIDNDSVAKKLQALLDFDFSNKVTQKSKLAVWLAFWGEAKFRPTYRRIRSRSDIGAEDTLRKLFQEAIEEGSYSFADASLLATGYTALIDGLWIDLLVAPRQLNRERAKKIATHYLHSVFPQHVQLTQ